MQQLTKEQQMLRELRQAATEVRWHVLNFGQTASALCENTFAWLINGAVYSATYERDPEARDNLHGVATDGNIFVCTCEEALLREQLANTVTGKPLDYTGVKFFNPGQNKIDFDSMPVGATLFVAEPEMLTDEAADNLGDIARKLDAVIVVLNPSNEPIYRDETFSSRISDGVLEFYRCESMPNLMELRA